MASPKSRCVVLCQSFVLHSFAHILSPLTLLFVILCAVKKWSKLKNRYRLRVKAAIEYTRTIDDFDNLVCLGLEPSAYILHACFFFFFSLNKWFSFVKMTTKFNQGMYAKMRTKKNEPFSKLGKRIVHVMERGSPSLPLPLSLSQRG